jgi:hypothetical protein
MLLRLLARLARVRATLAYAVIVTGVTVALATLGPKVADWVVRHVSTNLHNLSRGHFATLLESALVIDAGPIYVWLPGLVCLLGLAELTWGSVRLVVAFVAGHIGATLLVAAGLTAAVELGWLPVSVSRAADVGMSYGAMAVLGSLTTALPRRWRPAWIGWYLAAGVGVVAVGRDFTDVGHVVALALGMLMSTRFGRPHNWTPARLVLLGVAAAFGYLVLASTDMVVATAAGMAGAVIAECVRRARSRRRSVRKVSRRVGVAAAAPENNAREARSGHRL